MPQHFIWHPGLQLCPTRSPSGEALGPACRALPRRTTASSSPSSPPPATPPHPRHRTAPLGSRLLPAPNPGDPNPSQPAGSGTWAHREAPTPLERRGRSTRPPAVVPTPAAAGALSLTRGGSRRPRGEACAQRSLLTQRRGSGGERPGAPASAAPRSPRSPRSPRPRAAPPPGRWLPLSRPRPRAAQTRCGSASPAAPRPPARPPAGDPAAPRPAALRRAVQPRGGAGAPEPGFCLPGPWSQTREEMLRQAGLPRLRVCNGTFGITLDSPPEPATLVPYVGVGLMNGERDG